MPGSHLAGPTGCRMPRHDLPHGQPVLVPRRPRAPSPTRAMDSACYPQGRRKRKAGPVKITTGPGGSGGSPGSSPGHRDGRGLAVLPGGPADLHPRALLEATAARAPCWGFSCP